jgi:molybdopterin converting factor small subunit
MDSIVKFLSIMIVKFRFRGPLATRMPSEVYEIDLEDGGNLRTALEILIKNNNEIREHWESPEQIDRETLLLKNEVDIGLLNSLETLLDDGDVFVILPLVHGG